LQLGKQLGQSSITPEQEQQLARRIEKFFEDFKQFGQACASGQQKADDRYFSTISRLDVESQKITQQIALYSR